MGQAPTGLVVHRPGDTEAMQNIVNVVIRSEADGSNRARLLASMAGDVCEVCGCVCRHAVAIGSRSRAVFDPCQWLVRNCGDGGVLADVHHPRIDACELRHWFGQAHRTVMALALDDIDETTRRHALFCADWFAAVGACHMSDDADMIGLVHDYARNVLAAQVPCVAHSNPLFGHALQTHLHVVWATRDALGRSIRHLPHAVAILRAGWPAVCAGRRRVIGDLLPGASGNWRYVALAIELFVLVVLGAYPGSPVVCTSPGFRVAARRVWVTRWTLASEAARDGVCGLCDALAHLLSHPDCPMNHAFRCALADAGGGVPIAVDCCVGIVFAHALVYLVRSRPGVRDAVVARFTGWPAYEDAVVGDADFRRARSDIAHHPYRHEATGLAAATDVMTALSATIGRRCARVHAPTFAVDRIATDALVPWMGAMYTHPVNRLPLARGGLDTAERAVLARSGRGDGGPVLDMALSRTLVHRRVVRAAVVAALATNRDAGRGAGRALADVVRFLDPVLDALVADAVDGDTSRATVNGVFDRLLSHRPAVAWAAYFVTRAHARVNRSLVASMDAASAAAQLEAIVRRAARVGVPAHVEFNQADFVVCECCRDVCCMAQRFSGKKHRVSGRFTPFTVAGVKNTVVDMQTRRVVCARLKGQTAADCRVTPTSRVSLLGTHLVYDDRWFTLCGNPGCCMITEVALPFSRLGALGYMCIRCSSMTDAQLRRADAKAARNGHGDDDDSSSPAQGRPVAAATRTRRPASTKTFTTAPRAERKRPAVMGDAEPGAEVD